MKKMLVAVGLTVMLSGCALLEGMTSPLHKDVSAEQAAAETPEQTAMRITRNSIDELYGVITAVNKTIGNNVANKIWLPEQGQKFLDQSKQLRKQVDTAKSALAFGNIGDAQAQADVVKALIIKLQQEVALAARSGMLEVPTIFL